MCCHNQSVIGLAIQRFIYCFGGSFSYVTSTFANFTGTIIITINPSDEIFTINTDGTGLKQITNNSYDDWYPGFNSNGNLLYISKKISTCDDDIYQIPSSALSLTNPESQSSILNINACNNISDADPYGSKVNADIIAFVSNRDGRYGIYIADKSNGTVIPVIKKINVDLLGPVIQE